MKLWRRLVAECYGTAALAFVIFVSEGNAWAVGIGFWVIIVGCGFIGGAHFNPTVTLGAIARDLYFRHLQIHKSKEKSLVYFTDAIKEDLLYLVAQVVGAFLGSLFGQCIYDSTWSIAVSPASTEVQALFAELIFTGHLVLVVLVSAELMDSVIASGMAIAFTVLAGIATVGDISGGCFNPTVCIAIDAVKAIFADDVSKLDSWWVYIAGPFLGCALGTVIACTFLREKIQINKKKKMKWHPKEFAMGLLKDHIKSDN
ncbi:unnamed protein product [Blepharisma stoltei]|uniref:Aquaporin n=1 Tax=Blepharisma stoltei TaxID=1481888 RepID=A0AAU9JU51_9CILI|nr:unnamed protein product [Blepharisma stoltei]